jgi:EAL domain-containing protein (putative c-di-GMP-specific phosphodiesterase class I)
LGLETLGEGIEQQSQLRYLQHEHCDSGQGFLFGRPLQADAIDRLLQTTPPLPAPEHSDVT